VEGSLVCSGFCGCGILTSCGIGGTEKWAGTTTDDGRPLWAEHKKSGVQYCHKIRSLRRVWRWSKCRAFSNTKLSRGRRPCLRELELRDVREFEWAVNSSECVESECVFYIP
jgi:hypothetical protein